MVVEDHLHRAFHLLAGVGLEGNFPSGVEADELTVTAFFSFNKYIYRYNNKFFAKGGQNCDGGFGYSIHTASYS